MTERVRQAEESDHARIAQAISHWWAASRGADAARELASLVPRLFLQHFASTCLVAEKDGQFVGFLVGFYSHDRPRDAYIHFAGVSPDHRGMGWARTMYGEFFDKAVLADRMYVHCITSPVNKGSIAFHRRMGFEIVPGDAEQDGIPVHLNYDGRGTSRVCFRRDLFSWER